MIEISYSYLKWYTDQHIWVVGSRTTHGAHAYGEVFRLAVCEYTENCIVFATTGHARFEHARVLNNKTRAIPGMVSKPFNSPSVKSLHNRNYTHFYSKYTRIITSQQIPKPCIARILLFKTRACSNRAWPVVAKTMQFPVIRQRVK